MTGRATRQEDDTTGLAAVCPRCLAAAGDFCRDLATDFIVDAHPERTAKGYPAAMRMPPRSPGRRRLLLVVLLLGVFVVPWAVGSFFMTSLDPRLRSLPGGIVFVAVGVACLVGALWPRARRTLRRQDSFLGRHGRISTALLLLFGIGITAVALPMVIDWTAEPDVVVTSVRQSSTSWRGMQTIYTTRGSFSVAYFWHINVHPGRATLTLGHYSRMVLAVDQ